MQSLPAEILRELLLLSHRSTPARCKQSNLKLVCKQWHRAMWQYFGSCGKISFQQKCLFPNVLKLQSLPKFFIQQPDLHYLNNPCFNRLKYLTITFQNEMIAERTIPAAKLSFDLSSLQFSTRCD